jgi:lysophospholipase L1-like esterase
MERLRRGLVALGIVAATVLVGAPATQATPGRDTGAAAVAPSYTNPLTATSVLQDPFVVWDGTTYHAYFSNVGGSFYYVPYFTSPDLKTWTLQLATQVLATPGAWVDTSVVNNVSSPSVRKLSASSYVMYFTAVGNGTNGSVAGKKCIGVATATGPGGPFTGQTAPLLCPAGGVGEAVMDPSPIPGTSAMQIVYRKTGTSPGIYNVMLDSAATAIAAPPFNNPVRIWAPADATAWPEGAAVWKDGVVEDPTVVVSPGNVPYLLFSGQDPVTDARMVGTVRCAGGWGLGVINDCDDVPLEGGRLFGSSNAVVSPGGPQVFADENGRSWIAYHAQPAGTCTGGGCNGDLYLDRFCFAGDAPRTNAPTGTLQDNTTRSATCTTDIPKDWMTTWATGVEGSLFNYHPRFHNETWRQMLHAATGGSAVRVRLSNSGNTQPLTIDAASVGVAPSSQTTTSDLGTPVPLSFGGSASVTIPAGKELYSDAAVITVPDDRDVGVSVHIPTWPTIDPHGRKVALVVANPAALTAAETALRTHLQSAGEVVTTFDDDAQGADAHKPPDLGASSLVVISPSVSAAAIDDKYKDVAPPGTALGQPIVNLAAATWNKSGLTTSTAAPGSTSTTSAFPVGSGHLVANGKTAATTLLTASAALDTVPNSSLGSGAVNVWVPTSGSTDSVVAAYDTRTFTAVSGLRTGAPRVTLGYSAAAVSALNADGWALFDKAVAWANPGYLNNAGSSLGEETSFSGFGNLTGSGTSSAFAPAESNVQFVASVEVLATAPKGTVVVLADSLSDGSFGLNGVDQEALWPARVNTALQGAGTTTLSMVNAAIIGNTLLPGGNGLAVTDRFNRDALSHAGIKTVFLEIGANDLAFPKNGDGSYTARTPAQITTKATDIANGYQGLITRGHNVGVRVVAATIPPYAWRSKTSWFSNTGAAPSPAPWSQSLYKCFADDLATALPANESLITQQELDAEAVRDQVNARILPGSGSSLAFDAVVDFDQALRASPDDRKPVLDYLGWDCIHLTPTAPAGHTAGQAQLATTVPLAVVNP